ncbi:hypothetical protein L1987_35131 [Smallanthus sonchifolius]|uniref:Uncharacterized protein n=1 Tax=Smallanthus sonchifolius TaxID=185202 RepID=A0ACB9HYD8_9ASTR|nr:hypothetical protein L1987_35131 [Smallanthus sonchifolius]
MTTAPMTIALQIDRFCNCDGCIRKVKKALGKFDDAKLLEMDPEMGLFMILATTHPDAIKCAIKRPFPNKEIICVHLQDALPPPPPQTNVTPSAPPLPTTPDLVYGYPAEYYSPGLVYGYPVEYYPPDLVYGYPAE